MASLSPSPTYGLSLLIQGDTLSCSTHWVVLGGVLVVDCVVLVVVLVVVEVVLEVVLVVVVVSDIF